MQIKRDITRENKHRFDYDYIGIDNVRLTKYIAYKYMTPCNGPFFITQCFINGTVKLQCGAIQIRYNIRCIKLYKSDTKVEYYDSINIYDTVSI